ncbi:helix-turn-helix transcriptional regulator [Maribacter sp. BPC-D8]|uniref:helix-turn-helix transcriptional regulator n=1 Tax=Maribacter sp. BPC-D8 TaxID=3053613 RepID=UPI002B47E0D5|nr:helix-turn-helix transcriptional regulator [Maribacter sp. BPC-D8]WRI30663.1 helix-turn-helix transcriptional regulator [Maribacter sp. BPC-D8]
MIEIQNIKFNNESRPNLGFEVIRLEELMQRDIEQDITQLHKVEFYQIIVITEGSGKHTIDFTDYEYTNHTLFTIRKDQVHRFFKSPSAKGFLIIFTEDFLASLLSHQEVARCHELFNKFLTSPKISVNDEDFKGVVSLINHIEIEYTKNYDEFSSGIIRNELHIFIYRLLRIKLKQGVSLPQHKYVGDFLNFQQLIEDRCFQTKKTLDYANLMGCTPKTLNNICKAIVDKSSKAVIDDILVTQIKRLLINTSLSITEIAYTSGFDEPTNMYKYFKKHTEATPEAFRQQHA